MRGGAYGVMVGKPEGRRLVENLDVDGRIILKVIFEMWDRGMVWNWYGSE